MSGRSLALAALLSLSACGGDAPRLDLVSAHEVSLTVTVRETVSWRGRNPAKAVALSLRGSASADGDDEILRATVDWAELTYVDAEGTRVEMATDGMQPELETTDSLVRARRGLLEGLVGAPVELRFGPLPGSDDSAARLLVVDGLEAALASARAAVEHAPGQQADVVDAASGGLEPLLEDEGVLEGLRAAGLAGAAPALSSPGASVTRTARVHVDGRGWTDVALFGTASRGRGKAPTARLEGRPEPEAEFAGDAGMEPPAGLGAVRVDEMIVTAETELDPASGRPQRGSVTVELPYEAGPLVRRATEFLMVVIE